MPLLEEVEIDVVVVEAKPEEKAAAAANDINSDSEKFSQTELM